MEWPPEKIAKLREMHAQGALQKTISKELQYSAKRVHKKMAELGLKPNGRPRVDWTPEKVARLRGMSAAGDPLAVMAAEFDLSPTSISRKLKALGLKPPQGKKSNWTPEKIAKLKAMREEGATIMMMAEALDCSKKTIQNKLAALGLTSPQAQKINWTSKMISKLKTMREEGATYTMMAEAFGCSKATIYKKVAELGLT